MGSVTRYNTCTMSQISTFNMYLDSHKVESYSDEKKDFQQVLSYANGL